MQSDSPELTEEQLNIQQMHLQQKDDEYEMLFTKEKRHHNLDFEGNISPQTQAVAYPNSQDF